MGLLLPTRQQIDDPAAPHMRPALVAVGEDVGVVAPGILQRIGQDRQAVEGTVGVDAPGELDDRGGEPGGVEDGGAGRAV